MPPPNSRQVSPGAITATNACQGDDDPSHPNDWQYLAQHRGNFTQGPETPSSSGKSSKKSGKQVSSKGATAKDEKAVRLLEDEQETKFSKAAWMMADALDGQHAESYPDADHATILELWQISFRIFSSNQVFAFAVAALLALLFLEPPIWCDCVGWELLPAQHRCPLPEGSTLNVSGLPMLPPAFCLAAESLLLAAATGAMLLRLRTDSFLASKGYSGYTRTGMTPYQMLPVLLAMWLDLGLYVGFRQHSFRFAPYGRIILLFHFPRMCNVFAAVKSCAQEFANVAILILGSVLFFGWLTMMFLTDATVSSSVASPVATSLPDEFSNMGAASNSLFEIMTGAAFPDNILGVIKREPGTVLIFYPYMFLTFFLFTQLMLAILVNEYNECMTDELKDWYTCEIKGLVAVFALLCEPRSDGAGHVLRRETFETLVEDHLLASPMLKKKHKKTTSEAQRFNSSLSAVLWDALDDDKSGELDIDEFLEASDLLLFNIKFAPTYSWVVRRTGGTDGRFSFLVNLVHDGLVKKITRVVLMLNFGFIVVESAYAMAQLPAPWWVVPSQVAFSIYYVAEVLVTLSVISWPHYWNSTANRFDFTMAWVLLFGVGQILFCGARSKIIRYLNVLRAVRLLKLLKRTERFKRIGGAVHAMLEVSTDVGAMLLVTCGVFAVLGTQACGGKFYKENPVLKDSPLVQAKYEIHSFNDMGSSMLVLFDMMVNAYMPEYADAIDRVLGLPIVGVVYCGAFFFIGVNIAFNIYTAFTIDVFVMLREKATRNEKLADQETKNLKKMTKNLKKHDVLLLVSMPAEVLRRRVQREVCDGLEDQVDDVKKGQIREMMGQQALEEYLTGIASNGDDASLEERWQRVKQSIHPNP